MKFNTFSDKMAYLNIDLPVQQRFMRSPLILFEGIDLSGKTTVIEKMFQYFSPLLIDLKKYSEPTELNSIRSIVLDRNKKLDFFGGFIPEKNEEIIDYYLFLASRAHLFHIITNDLKNMSPVFLDRDFISSFVYQNSIANIGTEIASNLSTLSTLSTIGTLSTDIVPKSTNSVTKVTNSVTKDTNSVTSLVTKVTNYVTNKIFLLDRSTDIVTKDTELVTKVTRAHSKIDILEDSLKLYNYFSKIKGFTDGFNGPDLILLLDININTYILRKKERQNNNHYDESNIDDISKRIYLYREAFDIINSSDDFSSKIFIIDANRSLDDVVAECKSIISNYLVGCYKIFNHKNITDYRRVVYR